jgi:hypothetical protein
MKRWVFLPAGLGVLVASAALVPRAECERVRSAEAANPTVVELFTSQGCSSCPPADELLGELSRRPDVLAFSMPVDYWDYIGWKDTFASPENTARQRGYARSMHHRSIYTPEMVIGGMFDVVGSDRSKVTATLGSAMAQRPGETHVDVRPAQTSFTVTVHEGKAERPATVWLVRYDPEHSVAIRAGENNGRHVTYYNVVRTMKQIGMWTGRKLDVVVQRATLNEMPGERSAVIVQYGQTGPIVGARDFAQAETAHVVSGKLPN